MTPLNRNLALALLLGACGLAGCTNKDSTTDDSPTADDSNTTTDDSTADDSTADDSEEPGTPLVAITSPAFGATINASAVQLSMTIQNFEISQDVGGSAHDGMGHYHIYVDDAYRDFGTDLNSAWATRLSPGSHTIKIELVNNDHTSLNPVISDTVQITVAASSPYVSLDSPGFGDTLNTSTWPLAVSVNDFTLDPGNIGGGNIAGHGHYHVYVDGVYVDATANPNYTLLRQDTGDHIVEVVLAENDHTELDSRDYVRVNSPPNRPSMTITSPPPGENVGTNFTATVAIENFTLSGNVGGAAAPGEGHWHLFLDDSYVNYSTSNDLSVSGVGLGQHVLRAELYNNDHTELTQRVYDEVRFNVQ